MSADDLYLAGNSRLHQAISPSPPSPPLFQVKQEPLDGAQSVNGSLPSCPQGKVARKAKHIIDLTREDDADVIYISDDESAETCELPLAGSPEQASGPGCGICFESTSAGPLSCGHAYCPPCLGQYVMSKLSGYAPTLPIPCPDPNCQAHVVRDAVQHVLDASAIARWKDKEQAANIKHKVYCPNKRCSHLMDGSALRYRPYSKTVKCSKCRLSFCVECKAPHPRRTCKQYQALPVEKRHPEDMALLRLALEHKWKQCPSCHAMAELKEGCNHMYCPCGEEYCYVCGATWDKENKRCSSGKCILWDERMLHEEQQRQPPRARRLVLIPPPIRLPPIVINLPIDPRDLNLPLHWNVLQP